MLHTNTINKRWSDDELYAAVALYLESKLEDAIRSHNAVSRMICEDDRITQKSGSLAHWANVVSVLRWIISTLPAQRKLITQTETALKR